MTAAERAKLHLLVDAARRERVIKGDLVICEFPGCLNEFAATKARGGPSKAKRFCSERCRVRMKYKRLWAVTRREAA